MGVFGDDDSKDKCNVFIVSSNANWGSWLLSPPLSSRNAMERTACYSLMQMSMAPPEAGAPSCRDPPPLPTLPPAPFLCHGALLPLPPTKTS